MANKRKVCKRGHDLTLPDSRYTSNSSTRCRQCFREYQRNLQRNKRGVPNNAPVRPYVKRNPPKTKAQLKLIRIVEAEPDMAEVLLAMIGETV